MVRQGKVRVHALWLTQVVIIFLLPFLQKSLGFGLWNRIGVVRASVPRAKKKAAQTQGYWAVAGGMTF